MTAIHPITSKARRRSSSRTASSQGAVMISTIRAVTIAVLCLAYSPLASADLTKEQCLDAHSRGQDAKEQNHLSLARKLFLTCAQQSCPTVVQGDCARFADDLSRMQPSINLIARDG